MTPVKDYLEGSRPLLTCIPCNKSREQKPINSLGAAQPKQSDDSVRSDYPTRIIDLAELKNIIDPNLLRCTKYKQGQLQLVEKSRVSYSSIFELRCNIWLLSFGGEL